MSSKLQWAEAQRAFVRDGDAVAKAYDEGYAKGMSLGKESGFADGLAVGVAVRGARVPALLVTGTVAVSGILTSVVYHLTSYLISIAL